MWVWMKKRISTKWLMRGAVFVPLLLPLVLDVIKIHRKPLSFSISHHWLSIFNITVAAILLMTPVFLSIEKWIMRFTEPMIYKFKSSRIGKMILKPIGCMEKILGISIELDASGVISAILGLIMVGLLRGIIGSSLGADFITDLRRSMLSKQFMKYLLRHSAVVLTSSMLLGRSPTTNRVLRASFIAAAGYALMLRLENLALSRRLGKCKILGTVDRTGFYIIESMSEAPPYSLKIFGAIASKFFEVMGDKTSCTRIHFVDVLGSNVPVVFGNKIYCPYTLPLVFRKEGMAKLLL